MNDHLNNDDDGNMTMTMRNDDHDRVVVGYGGSMSALGPRSVGIVSQDFTGLEALVRLFRTGGGLLVVG